MSPKEVFLWPFKKIWSGIKFPFKFLGTILGSFGKVLVFAALCTAIALIFQTPRDWLLDKVNRPEVSTAFTGTETTRSARVTSLKPFKVCGLKPNTSYTFVKVTTSESVKNESGKTVFVYRTMSPNDGSVETHEVTGGFYNTPEDLPYSDANYAGGVLVNGIPPGRITDSNENGCVEVSLNRNPNSVRTLARELFLAVVLRSRT